MTNLNYENQRLVDIVNEDDEIIDAKTRTEAHRTGLLHREIHVWMRDKGRNIIFQRRGLDRQSAGLLDATVGGHVNKGEDYLSAAIRETKEETGISINASDLVLLKKLRGSEIAKNPFGSKNNFIRAVYFYKQPVHSEDIKKEAGIPGGGFQKFAIDFFLNPKEEHISSLLPFVFKEELPLVLEHKKNDI